MTINISAQVRQALYIFTAIGTPIMVYLLAKDLVSDLEMALWSAEVLVVSGLAAFKTTPEGEVQR